MNNNVVLIILCNREQQTE